MEVLPKLGINACSVEMWFFDDFDESFLVAEKIRVYVYKLRLILFWDFTQYVILACIVDSGAVVSSPQIEHCFADQ